MFIEIGYFMVILSFWRNNDIKVLDVYSKNGSHSGKRVGEKQNLMQKETACGLQGEILMAYTGNSNQNERGDDSLVLYGKQKIKLPWFSESSNAWVDWEAEV